MTPQGQKDCVREIRAVRRKLMRETAQMDEARSPLSYNYNQGAEYAYRKALRILTAHFEKAPAKKAAKPPAKRRAR